MVNSHDDEQSAAASAAMNRVLEAEQVAEQAVAECERQAQALLQAAYARAQRIAGRTEERISLLRMRCSERVTRQIEVRERVARAAREGESPGHPQGERLPAVVEALAAELSGGETQAVEGRAPP
jgi:hypothetical protein